MSTWGREVKEALGIVPRDPAAKGVPPASAPAPVPVMEVEERMPAPPTGPQKELPLT